MVFGVVLVWFCYGFGGFGSGFGMSLVGSGLLLVWFWYVSACMLLTACCLKQHLCSKPHGFRQFLLGATAALQIAGDSGPAVGGRRAVGDSAEGSSKLAVGGRRQQQRGVQQVRGPARQQTAATSLRTRDDAGERQRR